MSYGKRHRRHRRYGRGGDLPGHPGRKLALYRWRVVEPKAKAIMLRHIAARKAHRRGHHVHSHHFAQHRLLSLLNAK